jgi:hypothetical protein
VNYCYPKRSNWEIDGSIPVKADNLTAVRKSKEQRFLYARLPPRSKYRVGRNASDCANQVSLNRQTTGSPEGSFA